MIAWWTVEGGLEEYPLSVTITWYDFEAPSITLNTPDVVLATAASSFNIEISNYDVSASTDLSITWTLDPVAKNEEETVSISDYDTVLDFNVGALEYNSAYELEVKVVNTKLPDRAKASETFTFTTKQPPTSGSVSIDPPEGEFPDTEFTI